MTNTHTLTFFGVIGACIFLLTFFAGTSGVRAESVAPSDDVLTLIEASLFLKSDTDDVIHLMDEDCLPGRKIGGEWRFSRQGLLDWLSHKPPYDQCKRPAGSTAVLQHDGDSFVSSGDDLFKNPNLDLSGATLIEPVELSVVSARGTAGQDSADDNTIGERPELETAEESSLLGEQVLLKSEQITFELGLFYTTTEQQGLTIVPLNNVLMLAFSEGEQESVVTNFTARYGMKNDLQLSLSIPYLFLDNTTSATVPGSSEVQEQSSSRSEVGDIIVGLRHTLIREGISRPGVIVKAEGHIPTGDSSTGLSAGMSLIKRFDPVVLYSDLSYRHVYSRAFDDVTRLQPENIVQASLGYSLSLNDRTAFSSSVSGTFTSRTTFDKPGLPELRSSKRFNLSLGMTNLLSEKMHMETSVSFALNGPRSVTFGVTIPYTFTLNSDN